MPQGKGTYKKKYNKGGNVDPFSTRNPKGVPAEQMAEAMENQNMANAGLPTSNAQERSQVAPDVTSYNEGGKVKSKKVDITDIVKDVEALKKRKEEKREHEDYRAHTQDLATRTFHPLHPDDPLPRLKSIKHPSDEDIRKAGKDITKKQSDIKKKKKKILKKGKKK